MPLNGAFSGASSGRWLGLGGIALLWLGLAVFVFASSVNPRGALARAGSGYAARLDVDLRALFRAPRGRELAWFQLTSAVACLGVYGFCPHAALLAVTLAVAVAPPVVLRLQVARRRAKIDDQANGFALALANTLKSTASVGDALRLTLDVTALPMRQEIATALGEVRVGSTLEEALLATAARAGSPALDVVVSALLIGQKTGGDLPRILEGTATSLRELKRLEELTDRVTRSAKQSLAVAASITAGLAVMLPRVMPGFLDPVVTTTKGQVVLLQCVLVYFFALFLGWRFTRKSI